MTLAFIKPSQVATHTRLWPRLVIPVFVALLLVAGRAAPAAVVHGQGLLWQIDHEGVGPSYLFGTMHVTDDAVVTLPPAVAQAFARADSLTVEVILTPETPYRMLQAMVLRDGRSLDGILGGELFGRTAAVAAGYGFDPAVLKGLKPWAAMTLLSLPLAELQRRAAGKEALDERLQTEARGRGLVLHALESMDEQIAVFDGMKEADQVAMLAAVVDTNGELDGLFAGMLDAYLARDTARILALSETQQAGFDPALAEAFNEQVIFARNDRMVARMAPRLAEGGSFIAVGALHLPGARGIVSQLQDRGYRVTRLY